VEPTGEKCSNKASRTQARCPIVPSALLTVCMATKASLYDVQGFIGPPVTNRVKLPSGTAQLVEPSTIDEGAELERALRQHAWLKP
jgi:hypothetical protein